jgi:hypothetical protein
VNDDDKERILNRQFRIAAMMVALSLFAATPGLRAEDRDKCQRAVEKAESRLDRAIQKRGEHSREAEERRRDLNAQRERCWGANHRWWNGKEHRWETEHNWEDRH